MPLMTIDIDMAMIIFLRASISNFLLVVSVVLLPLIIESTKRSVKKVLMIPSNKPIKKC